MEYSTVRAKDPLDVAGVYGLTTVQCINSTPYITPIPFYTCYNTKRTIHYNTDIANATVLYGEQYSTEALLIHPPNISSRTHLGKVRLYSTACAIVCGYICTSTAKKTYRASFRADQSCCFPTMTNQD